MRLTLLLALTTAAAFAESGPPSIRFTGAPTDGGQTCAACHTGSTDPRGSVTMDVGEYNPGVLQTIHVTVAHPQASRWGFQMTARVVSDETKEAGTFTSNSSQVQVRCDDGSRFGAAPPCGGSREFAEHVLAPRTAAGAGFTFDVQWLPPANEVGDVRFYLSAVAANGDDSPTGDFVYTAVKTVSFTGACTLTKKPTLRTAVNGASFLTAFSSASMLTIFGFDFQVPGRTRQVGGGDIVNGMFPTQLACVAVEMNGQRLPIAYIQQDQINVQAPVLTSTGPVSLVVILNPGRPNELRSDIATLTPQPVAPALFVTGTTSVAAAQYPSGGSSAKPGDIVVLYGTGFGDTTPSVASGQIATGLARLKQQPSITVGGVPVAPEDVLYAGLSPGSISGLYQLNIRLPKTLPAGDLPVVVTSGGAQSQPGVTIRVDNL